VISLAANVVANSARLRKPQRSFVLDVQIADAMELDGRRAGAAGKWLLPQRLGSNSELVCHRSPTIHDPR
jgi:hypothetical protein